MLCDHAFNNSNFGRTLPAVAIEAIFAFVKIPIYAKHEWRHQHRCMEARAIEQQRPTAEAIVTRLADGNVMERMLSGRQP
jgi:hypothetical protein